MKRFWLLPVFVLLILPMILYTGRYRTSPTNISVEETTTYPDDPSIRSSSYGRYGNRQLDIVQRDPTHFDFIFTSPDPHIATITFADIDLVEREWNRQQASFSPTSLHIQIIGGDSFETHNTYSLELSRNCLNAGLWEILLFQNTDGQKQLDYQGWFTFPLNLYKQLFETLNQASYWNYWYRLEPWTDPEGTPVDLRTLRTVSTEKILDHTSETITVSGEQSRKQKTWKQEDDETVFATFAPPGRYDLSSPWPHCLLISGIDLSTLPVTSDYTQGLALLMGISVPPVYQTYDELAANPPADSPYVSLLLHPDDRSINHHLTGVDGAIFHRDSQDPRLIHL